MTEYSKVSNKKSKPPIKDDRDLYESIYPGKLNFRKEPGGEVLFILKKGERMRFTGMVEEFDGVDWLSMEARGKQGFVMERYVEKV